MNNQVNLGVFLAAIVFSLLIGGGAGAVFFNGTNSTSGSTLQTPVEKLDVAEDEVTRLTNRLNTLQRQSDVWKDQSEEAVEELKETRKTLGERRSEIARLKAKVLGLERKLDRSLALNTRKRGKDEKEPETLKPYKVRFQMRTRGGRRSRDKTAITKEIEAISFSEARKKIREQYPGANIVTIEELEPAQDD